MQNPSAPWEACVPEAPSIPCMTVFQQGGEGDLLSGWGCGAASPTETLPEPSSSGQTFGAGKDNCFLEIRPGQASLACL